MLSGSRGSADPAIRYPASRHSGSRMQSVALQKDRDALMASVEDIERRKSLTM